MAHLNNTSENANGGSNIIGQERCAFYFLFHGETKLGNGFRGFLYFAALAYCFIGLTAITGRFFRSMENVVKHTRAVQEIDPFTNVEVIKHKKVWNYAIADIALLAFGTSFPQISLATIDAIRNIGNLYAGGLGPGTLVGSAAFDLFPIHAVCVVVPKAGELKKISDIGVWLVELIWSFWAYVWLYLILKVWTPNVITLLEASLTVLQYGLLLTHAYAQDKRWKYFSLPIKKTERPEDWVPPEKYTHGDGRQPHEKYLEILKDGENRNRTIVDIFSIHGDNNDTMKLGVKEARIVTVLGMFPTATKDGFSVVYLYAAKDAEENCFKEVYRIKQSHEMISEKNNLFAIWKEQFVDALKLECPESRKLNNTWLRLAKGFWRLLCVPWKLLFAFVPPHQIAHGWIAFIFSLAFISGIAYVVTKFTDLISCVTGIDPYVIAFTALAAGTSWPDLVASKIAAERQLTADSAIANITCSNSVNIYVGIGVPWLINTLYNHFAYKEPLRIENAGGLSFSLLMFFATSVGCIGVLIYRRLTLGAELGGPRLWAWITSVFLILLWLIFVVLSSLRVSGVI